MSSLPISSMVVLAVLLVGVVVPVLVPRVGVALSCASLLGGAGVLLTQRTHAVVAMYLISYGMLWLVLAGLVLWTQKRMASDPV